MVQECLTPDEICVFGGYVKEGEEWIPGKLVLKMFEFHPEEIRILVDETSGALIFQNEKTADMKLLVSAKFWCRKSELEAA